MDKLTYKDAGVDTKEGERAVELMKKHVKSTFNDNVLADIGSFGGLFSLPMANIKEPVLVSGTDGVGTKLKLAFMMDKHDTIGIDAVAMCVNDILCQGARPLFFLDYIATGKVKAEKIADIVSGIAKGCVESNCALIGGETAEMPDFYEDGEYDIAGFAVGLADKSKIITGSGIKAGMSLIGLSSSGIHSNGYSLVRKICIEKMGFSLDDYIEELGDTLGNTLLEPTKLYVKPCVALFDKVDIKGIVHITGGGFFENIPRILPEGIGVSIDKNAWNKLPIFEFLQKNGNIDELEMYKTFNMGIGMMLVVEKEDEEKVLDILKNIGQEAYLIGSTVESQEKVALYE